MGDTWDFMKAVPLPLKLGLESRINEGEKGQGDGAGSNSWRSHTLTLGPWTNSV